MVCAFFYQLGVISGDPIEACGDRACIILDGRERAGSWDIIARKEAQARGFIGYRLERGERLQDTRPIGKLILLNQ